MMVLARSTGLVTCSRESSTSGRRCSERSLCLAAYECAREEASRCLTLVDVFGASLLSAPILKHSASQIPRRQRL